MSKWIKIDFDDESTLPSNSMGVMVFISGTLQMMYYDIDTGYFDSNHATKCVTHWMELPENP